MKTIHYFNHSIVDGERGMLAANGTRLASFLGKRYAEDDRTKFCEKTFVAPQHLAAQTALSFFVDLCGGSNVSPADYADNLRAGY